MRYDMRDMKQNIYELELMLRAFMMEEDDFPIVNPDSTFVSGTTRAVREFQRRNGLEETGIVDYFTWVKLYEAYERNKYNFNHSQTRIT